MPQEQSVKAPEATGPDVAERAGLGIYPWYVVVVMFFLYFANQVDRQILSILLEPIKAEFGATDMMMGFLTGPAFAIFYATAGIPIARLADRRSRKTVIALSAALWSLLTAVSGLATSFTQLALLRVGVGVGEAGCTPPAQSLIADYFPPERRGRAMGIYAAGATAGVAFGFLIGGLLFSLFGWRITLIAVGAPGIALAGLVWLTVREPPRGRFERGTSTEAMPSGEAYRFLWTQRSYVHLQIGAALHAMASYGVSIWIVPFFMRVHGLELPATTTMLGIVMLVIGIPSLIAGGWLADLLSARDARWYLWVPTWGAILAAPFSVMFLFAPTEQLAIAAYVPHSLLNLLYAGPIFAITQAIVVPRARALAVAVHLLAANLIGLGLGPLAVGALNDYLAPTYGQQAIRYTMLIAVAGNVVATIFYLTAARTLRADIARAQRDA
jgi:MFS family permease